MTPAERNRWALVIGGVALMALAATWVLWFLDNYERRERTVRGDASAEARGNPYLAAQRYLSRLGYGVASMRGRGRLKSPPDRIGTLLVHDAGPSLPAENEARLLDWVAGGGHLVLVPRRVVDPETTAGWNHLYQRFGVRLHRRVAEPGEEDEPEPEPVVPDEAPDLVTVEVPEGGAYRVAFDPALYLEDTAPEAQEVLAGERGAHMLGFEHGAGRVTVFSDNKFMLNERIGEHDHAWFVSDLVKDHDRAWFLTDTGMPPLTRMLWRHAPEASLSAILLGLLALWRAAVTHGPRLGAGTRVRRDLIEHLEAAAAFAWYRDPDRALLQRGRTALERQWRRRHPGLHRMDEVDRCAWIAARSGLTEDAVRRALLEPPRDEQSLIEHTVAQQKLAGALSPRTETIEERR